MNFIIFASILVPFCFINNIYAYKINLKVANGTEVEEGEFKFAVSIRYNLKHICGGTILNGNHVLTAAHCVCMENTPINATLLSVQYGSIHITNTTERSVNIANVTCANFSSITFENDVAILTLDENLPSDDSWESVKLATQFNTSVAARGGHIIGWGELTQGGPLSETLRKLSVTTYNDFICSENEIFDPEIHICFAALYGSACAGDMGGALLSDIKGEQIGVGTLNPGPCGSAYPSMANVYTKITAYRDWILQNAGISN